MLALNLVISAWMCVVWFAARDFIRVNAATVGASGSDLAQKRAVVLNDGKKYRTGNITAFPGVNWQSSGVLTEGGCTYSVHKISKCYTYSLSSNKKSNLDPYGDQINYFLSPSVTIPTSSKTVTYTYKWKSYIESTAQSTAHFFLTIIHSQGLEDEWGDGDSFAGFKSFGPAQGKTGMYYGTNSSAWGVSTSWAKYRGRTTSHVMKLALANGRVNGYDYKITDTSTGATLVNSKENVFSALRDVSLQIGILRYATTGMSAYKAHWGDYSFSKS